MNLGIGLSALRASQYAINSVSHNIANASTEGYHRQEVGFQAGLPQVIRGRFIGSGVEISGIRRYRSQIIESTYTNSVADLSNIEQRLQIETRIESFFLPGQGSIQNALTGMFDELARLSANPGEKTLRNSVVNQGVNLAQRVQKISNELVDLQTTVDRQLDLELVALNQEIKDLVSLQNRIKSSNVNGASIDLLDTRDQLINSIAQRVDVQRFENVQESLGLSLAGSSVSIGVAPIEFESVKSEDGTVAVRVVGSDRETKFVSGKIAALIEVNNSVVGKFSDKIEQFSNKLMRHIDQAHAVGLGLEGPFSVLQGIRRVDNTSIPLNDAGLAFPIEAGELTFSITSPNGNRRTGSIVIDPAVDSLEDVAARIGAIPDIQAVVDSNTGKMTIIAAPGSKFDFTGNLETTPDITALTGTSIPTLGGVYRGNQNETFDVVLVGSGEIGKTPGLKAQITNAAGQVIKEISIGEDYEAGSEIEIVEGVTVSFSAGTIIDSESFDAIVVGDSDTTGILAALGFNSFFQGRNSSDIAVNDRIVDNPSRIASTKTGISGDTRNLKGLLDLRTQGVLVNNQQSFDDFLSETNTEIGFQVQNSISIQINLSELNFQYQTERDSISGIDVNEELLSLTQHQKSYEAAIQVVRTMESMLDELFQIIR